MLPDLGGEALLGLVMPLRLLLGRLGAALDLGKVAAAAGERFFRERFRPAAGGLFGLLAGLTDGSFESCPRLLRLRLRGLGVTPGLLGLGQHRRARASAAFCISALACSRARRR